MTESDFFFGIIISLSAVYFIWIFDLIFYSLWEYSYENILMRIFLWEYFSFFLSCTLYVLNTNSTFEWLCSLLSYNSFLFSLLFLLFIIIIIPTSLHGLGWFTYSFIYLFIYLFYSFFFFFPFRNSRVQM